VVTSSDDIVVADFSREGSVFVLSRTGEATRRHGVPGEVICGFGALVRSFPFKKGRFWALYLRDSAISLRVGDIEMGVAPENVRVRLAGVTPFRRTLVLSSRSFSTMQTCTSLRFGSGDGHFFEYIVDSLESGDARNRFVCMWTNNVVGKEWSESMAKAFEDCVKAKRSE
jgi:hypothetical protein